MHGFPVYCATKLHQVLVTFPMRPVALGLRLPEHFMSTHYPFLHQELGTFAAVGSVTLAAML